MLILSLLIDLLLSVPRARIRQLRATVASLERELASLKRR